MRFIVSVLGLLLCGNLMSGELPKFRYGDFVKVNIKNVSIEQSFYGCYTGEQQATIFGLKKTRKQKYDKTVDNYVNAKGYWFAYDIKPFHCEFPGKFFVEQEDIVGVLK